MVPFIKNDFSPLMCNIVIIIVLKKILETHTRGQTPRMGPCDNPKYLKKIPEEKFEIIKNLHFLKCFCILEKNTFYSYFPVFNTKKLAKNEVF